MPSRGRYLFPEPHLRQSMKAHPESTRRLNDSPGVTIDEAEPKFSRREMLQSGGAALLASALPTFPQGLLAQQQDGERPQPADRRFRSAAVEQYITSTRTQIADPELSRLFANCFPNILDTTVEPGSFEGKPDTVVITGDIAAMWQRDSSAQVWPYLDLARSDDRLRSLLEGVIRRQTRNLLIIPTPTPSWPTSARRRSSGAATIKPR